MFDDIPENKEESYICLECGVGDIYLDKMDDVWKCSNCQWFAHPVSENNKKKRPKVIVVEGLDGSGKSTQIPFLQEFLCKKGFSVGVEFEPTINYFGYDFRDLLKSDLSLSKDEDLMLFLLDRINHSRNIMRSNYDFLILDRYHYSTLLYQIYSNEEFMNDKYLLNFVNRITKKHFIKPDIVFWIEGDFRTTVEDRFEANREKLKEIAKDKFLFHNQFVKIKNHKVYKDVLHPDICTHTKRIIENDYPKETINLYI